MSIKIQITHPASLNKSPHRLKKEFPPYHLTKPYLRNQKYHPTNENVSNNKRNRKQNVIWFNPPFSVHVKKKSEIFF